MILFHKFRFVLQSTCPHTRGDDPVWWGGNTNDSFLSPYAWGWSYEEEDIKLWDKLVPIRVGMIKDFRSMQRSAKTCPHTRGDDQILKDFCNVRRNLSPYAWGWSYPSKYRRKWRFLVPIRVGMILIWAYVFRVQFTCPHTRGDDPMRITYIINTQGLSPYAWGWSCALLCPRRPWWLVPIRVGMILSMKNALFENGTCPHTRGDDPITAKEHHVIESLSPYAWGWSLYPVGLGCGC